MITSKLELLVDFGQNPNQALVTKTLTELKAQDGVKEAIFKDGAIMVETTLPSAVLVDLTAKVSGRRTVLQGFGDSQQSAVAMISSQPGYERQVVGVVRFSQTPEGLIAEGTIDGLTGKHGLHIHEQGDLSEGCKSIGGHFNPTNSPHGGPKDPASSRHAGDLGNVVADDTGRATFRIVDRVLKVWDIVGRSVAVSEKADDFGRGSSPTSKLDGDSGQPVACGVIARSAGVFQNPKRVCACDGVVVWDERDRPLAGKGRRDTRRCCEKEEESDKTEAKPCCKC